MQVLIVAGGVVLGLIVYTFLPELIKVAFWVAPLVILAFIAIVAFNG